MCVEIDALCDGSWERLTTIADLEAALQTEAVLHYPATNVPKDGCCLCPVDVEATAKRAGWNLRGTDDPFVPFILTPNASYTSHARGNQTGVDQTKP